MRQWSTIMHCRFMWWTELAFWQILLTVEHFFGCGGWHICKKTIRMRTEINNSWLNTQWTNELPLSSIKKERWKDKESTSTYFLICYDGGYHANTNKPGYPLPPMTTTTTTTTTTKSHQTIKTDIINSKNKNEIKT